MDASKTENLVVKEIVDGTHPAVYKRVAFAAGLNSNAIKAGQIIGLSNGKLAVADGSTTPVYGVVMKDYDTTAAGFANVCVHGTVVKAELKGYSGASAATDAEIAKLEEKGIWAY